MTLSERQHQILGLAVDGYISAGEPVSSDWVAERLVAPVSTATVRAELNALEQADYLQQPHVSAGRVPTEKGYRYYIKNFVRPSAERTAVEKLARSWQELAAVDQEEKIRGSAKILATLVGQMMVVVGGEQLVYTTGMGQLLRAREAQNLQILQELMNGFDRLENILPQLLIMADDDVKVLVGRDNPVDHSCALLVTKCRLAEEERLIGMLGFMRMNYERNIALLQVMKKLMEQL